MEEEDTVDYVSHSRPSLSDEPDSKRVRFNSGKLGWRRRRYGNSALLAAVAASTRYYRRKYRMNRGYNYFKRYKNYGRYRYKYRYYWRSKFRR